METITVQVCLGTACYVKGNQDVLDSVAQALGIRPGEKTADGRFALEATRCLSNCGVGPVMKVNDTVYGHMTPDEAVRIINELQEA